jgi:hypothetical protein
MSAVLRLWEIPEREVAMDKVDIRPFRPRVPSAYNWSDKRFCHTFLQRTDYHKGKQKTLFVMIANNFSIAVW